MKLRVTISINVQTLRYVDRLVGKRGDSRSAVVESLIREAWRRQREAALVPCPPKKVLPPTPGGTEIVRRTQTTKELFQAVTGLARRVRVACSHHHNGLRRRGPGNDGRHDRDEPSM